MANHEDELALRGFSFRFSAKKARDRQLAEWVAADTGRGEVNISEVIKDLLYAWYLERWEIRSLPLPLIADDEVLVRVKSCGICGSDVHGMDGSTRRRIPPLIMGHEASGIIEKVGSGNYYDRTLARRFCVEMGNVTIKPTIKYKEQEITPKPEPKTKVVKQEKTTKKPIKKIVAKKIVTQKPTLNTNALLKPISLDELEDILETIKKY